MSAAPEKTLCVTSMTLGDCVCMLPEIRFLAERHGRPVDILTKTPALIDLYSGIEYIERVFPVRHWRFWPLLLFHVLPLLKRGKYDHIYFLDGRKHERKFLWVFGFARHLPCQIRWGFPEEVREAGRRPDLMAPLALGPAGLTVNDRERTEIRRFLSETYNWNGEPLVLFHPGSSYAEAGKRSRKHRRDSGNTKQWPVENWRKTISGVKELAPDSFFFVTGSAKERGLAEEILAGLPGRKTASLAGRLSLRQLLALQSMAHSCIAVDTGAAHTAMAVGCPTVVLYDNCDPRVMGRCSPKGWGPGITIRGFRNYEELTAGGCREPIKNIQPETVVRLWATLPLRPPEPPPECFVAHYREGDKEPEILPLLC